MPDPEGTESANPLTWTEAIADGVVSVNDYLMSMSDYVDESCAEITKQLSTASFRDVFPFVFGHHSEHDGMNTGRNLCAIMLKKSLLHAAAAITASHQTNIHSMAIHARIILECAGNVVTYVKPATEIEEPQRYAESKRTLNILEYQCQSEMLRLTSGEITRQDLDEIIVEARERAFQETGCLLAARRPHRVRIVDTLECLPEAREIYSLLSDGFFHVNLAVLSDSEGQLGSVVMLNPDLNLRLAAIVLDYIGQAVNRMLVSYGFLLSGITGDDTAFERALEILAHRKASLDDHILSESSGPSA